MGRRLVPLTLDNLEDLPKRCRACVFWELDPVSGEAAVKAGTPALEKEAWISAVLLDWGSCGRVVYVDGIVYAADLSGHLYALDAETGALHWMHDVYAAVWGSPFVADGKVYLGDEDGDVIVLAAGKEKKVLFEGNMGGAVLSTPVAKDGVLYVMSRRRLFALKTGARWTPPAAAPVATPAAGGAEQGAR